MKTCSKCHGLNYDEETSCHHCSAAFKLEPEPKPQEAIEQNPPKTQNAWAEVKGQLALWGIFLCFCVAGACWDTIVNHTWRDKLRLQPTSSEELSTYWGVFIASSMMFILLVIYSLPTLIRFCKGLAKLLWWLFIVGLVLFGIWSLMSGIVAMSTTTFLLLIIIWQLSSMQNKNNQG